MAVRAFEKYIIIYLFFKHKIEKKYNDLNFIKDILIFL